MSKKSFNFGVIIGAVLGGVFAYFFSPRSGKENRKIAQKAYRDLMKSVDEKGIDITVQEIFGTVTKEGEKLYKMAQKEMDTRLDKVYETVTEMDFDQYQDLVNETLQKVEKEVATTKERLTQLKQHLLKRWNALEKE